MIRGDAKVIIRRREIAMARLRESLR